MISLFDPGFIHSTGCAGNQSPYLGFRSELLGRVSLPCWLQKQAARQQGEQAEKPSHSQHRACRLLLSKPCQRGHPNTPKCGAKQGRARQQSKSYLGPFQSPLSEEWAVSSRGSLHRESAATLNIPRAVHTYLSYKKLHWPGRLTP